MLQRQGAYQTDMLQRKGDMYVQQQEQDRIASLYGLAADRQTGTSQAYNTAQSQFSSSLGNLGSTIAGGVASGAFDFLKKSHKYKDYMYRIIVWQKEKILWKKQIFLVIDY